MHINPTLKYFIANTIYGTIGLFLSFVNASSEFVVLCRGTIGSLFIFLIMFLKHDLPNLNSIKKNFKYLAISGIFLGLNWVFLFAGYKYSVSITSLCNYMAPIIIVVISAIFLKEKITQRQVLCVAMACLGITLVSGILDETGTVDYHCIVYGLVAAAGFVILVLCNRKLRDIKSLDKTVVQLLVSAVTVLPYVLLNNSFPNSLDMKSLIIVIVLGVVHTGIAYILYFNSIDVLPVIQVAIIGYIEPVLAIILGATIMHEKLTIFGFIGAVLIISAAIINELSSKKDA